MSMRCASDELIAGLGAALSVLMSSLETCAGPAGKMVLIPGTYEFYLLAFSVSVKFWLSISNAEGCGPSCPHLTWPDTTEILWFVFLNKMSALSSIALGLLSWVRSGHSFLTYIEIRPGASPRQQTGLGFHSNLGLPSPEQKWFLEQKESKDSKGSTLMVHTFLDYSLFTLSTINLFLLWKPHFCLLLLSEGDIY